MVCTPWAVYYLQNSQQKEAITCAHDAIVHVCFHDLPVHTIVQIVKKPDMQTIDKVCAQQARTYNKDSKRSEK